MEATNILTADLLDIVFDGRNKGYGAYELRRHYHQRMSRALLITAGVCLLTGATVWLKSQLTAPDPGAVFRILPGLTITEIPPVVAEPPPLPAPPATVEPPKIRTTAWVHQVVTHEQVVTAPPTQSELRDTRISHIAQEGVTGIDIVTPPQSLDGRKGIIASVRSKDPGEAIFKKVEIDAVYDGDWRRFLERNLSGEVAVDNGAAPGLHTVLIEFIVDKEGRVSGIRPLTAKGFGMEEEAMRVIQQSGRWKPAIQNGVPVKAYRRQPITFQVLEQ